MTSDFFIHAVQLVLERFTSILALHGEDIFERFFLAAQDLHFFLVSVELFVEGTAQIHQRVELALQVSSVVAASLGGAIVLAY